MGNSINNFMITGLVAGLAFSGFITATLKFFGIYFNPISLFFILLCAASIFHLITTPAVNRLFSFVIFYGMIFFLGFIVKYLPNSNLIDSSSILIGFFPLASILFFYLGRTIAIPYDRKIKAILVAAGLVSLVAATLQFIFFSILPQSFVELPVANVGDATSHFPREYEDIYVYRPNGLIANPISFGFFLNMFFLLFFLKSPRRLTVIVGAVVFLLIILLASRSNIISSVTIVLALSIAYLGRRSLWTTAIPLIIIFLVLFIYSDTDMINRFFYAFDRLSGVDPWVAKSNQEHFEQLVSFDALIGLNWLVGIPVNADAIESKIITDGSLLASMLRYGIFIGLVPFVVPIVSSLCRIKQGCTKAETIVLSLCTIIFMISMLFNSAIFHLLNLFFTFYLFGNISRGRHMQTSNER